jgi:hypothetical protein
MRKGIDHCIQNRIPTMLFCSQLSTVTWIDHGKKVIFSQNNWIQVEKDIFKSEFNIEE